MPLDHVGRAQADALRDLLAEARIDAVHVSPLDRALATAGPIANARGLTPRVDPDLVEFDYGDYGGTVRGAVALNISRDHLHTPVPGGESLADAWLRARRVAERLAPALRAGGHLLVVGHQRLNRLLVGAVAARTLDDAVRDKSYRPEHGAVLDLWFDGELRIVERRVRAQLEADGTSALRPSEPGRDSSSVNTDGARARREPTRLLPTTAAASRWLARVLQSRGMRRP